MKTNKIVQKEDKITTMKLPKSLLKRLKKARKHPRDTYADTITKLLDGL